MVLELLHLQKKFLRKRTKKSRQKKQINNKKCPSLTTLNVNTETTSTVGSKFEAFFLPQLVLALEGLNLRLRFQFFGLKTTLPIPDKISKNIITYIFYLSFEV